MQGEYDVCQAKQDGTCPWTQCPQDAQGYCPLPFLGWQNEERNEEIGR